MICQYCKNTTLDKFLPSLDNNQENYWTNLIANGSATENAHLLHYLSHNESAITVAPDITYKDVVSTRQTRTYETNPPFYVLSAIAFVMTNDNKYILLERNSGDWPHSVELPGGFLRAGGEMDTDKFIKARIGRDLSLSTQEIGNVTFQDLFFYPEILEAMLVYQSTITLSSGELLERQPLAQIIPTTYKPEHQAEYSSLPLHKPSQTIIEKFLTKNVL